MQDSGRSKSSTQAYHQQIFKVIKLKLSVFTTKDIFIDYNQKP